MREDRPLSLAVAERSGVRHESPQVIYFAGKKAVSQASHYGITAATLRDMIASK